MTGTIFVNYRQKIRSAPPVGYMTGWSRHSVGKIFLWMSSGPISKHD